MGVTWRDQSIRRSDIGLIVPGGSSGERAISPAYWSYTAERLRREMGVTQWMILDTDGSADTLKIPNARTLLCPQPPSYLLDLCRSACVIVGVSTSITHLAPLTGTPALVIEHPTTLPWLYRAPVPFVRYMRPQNPWWRENPSEQDLDRALAGPDTGPNESYGFLPGEFELQVDQEVSHLAAIRTLCLEL